MIALNGIKGSNSDVLATMTVPLDSDADTISDKWERQMVRDWNTQNGTSDAVNAAFFGPTDDKEKLDPDGAGPLVAQRTAGDAIPVNVEYRGFILNGGGYDGAGMNPHMGGHIRLNPSRKEALLEVDRESQLNNLPGGPGMDIYFRTAARVLSHATRGAGIYLYYMVDDLALPATGFSADDDAATVESKQREYLRATRGRAGALDGVSDNIKRYFTHALVLSNVPANHRPPPDVPAWSKELSLGWLDPDQCGIYFLTEEIKKHADILSLTAGNFGGVVMAHEFVHHAIHPAGNNPAWNTEEHLITSPTGTELMYRFGSSLNRDEATVMVGAATEGELDLDGNTALQP